MTAGALRDYLTHQCAEWGDNIDVMLAIPVQVGVLPDGQSVTNFLAGILGTAALLDLRGERARSDLRLLGMLVRIEAESGIIRETVLVPRPKDLKPGGGHETGFDAR